MKSRLVYQTICASILLTIVFSIGLSAQSGTAIKGVVRSSSGRVHSSVWVIISQYGNEKGRSLTGDDGKYYISNLGDGVYDLTVYDGERRLYRGQINLPADSEHNILLR